MEILEEYVELVKGEKWHEPFVRWSFLTYASACIGRKVYLRNGTDYEYPTIYVMFVAPPSAKKTSAAKAPKELFYGYQQNKPVIAADVMTPAAWILELQEAEEKIGKIDRHAPLYIMSKEFSTVLRDIGGGSPLDLLLSFYDSRAPGEIFRKRTITGGVTELQNPAVTILGCTTPDGLYDSQIMKSGSTGFVSRFIIVAHPTHISGSFNRPLIDQGKCLKFAAMFDELASIRGEMQLDASGNAYAEQVFNEIDLILQNGAKTRYLEEYYGRKLTQIYKVGMIFACLRKSRVISKDDMERAYRMITETEKTFDYMFAPRVIYRDSALSQKVLYALSKKPALNERELFEIINAQGIQPRNTDFHSVITSMMADQIVVTEKDGVRTYAKKT